MRILHVNCNYITSALHQVMMEHFDNSIENHVFVPTYDKQQAVIRPNDNVSVSECFEKKDRFIYQYKQKKIVEAIEKTYDISKFECIHAYTLYTDGNVAMTLSKKYHIPYVVAVRNTDVNIFFKYMIHLRKLGVEILKNASAIFFLSSAYRDKVIRKYVPASLGEYILKKSYMVPNGIDDFWLKNRVKEISHHHIERLLNKEVKIIYAGKIDKNKNIITTAKALHVLQNKGWRVSYTIVGRCTDKNELGKAMKITNVLYYEQMSKEKLIRMYRDNDIFVMPSLSETFGLVYAEAMSQGLPVVYSSGQGFDGQYKQGTVGFSVKSRSSSDIVEAIEKIAQNYLAIAEEASYLSMNYDWHMIVAKYIDIYRKIIKNNVPN